MEHAHNLVLGEEIMNENQLRQLEIELERVRRAIKLDDDEAALKALDRAQNNLAHVFAVVTR